MENEKKKQKAYDILRQSLETKYNKEKQEMENKMNLQLKEYQDKLNEMKNQTEEKKKIEKERDELELKLKNKIQRLESERFARNKIFESEVIRDENQGNKNNQQLVNKLTNIVKKIFKIKGIIEDLKRNVELDLFLSKNLIGHYNDPNTPMNIFIRVENYEEGNVYYWSQNTFNDRYDSLKELYTRFLEENYDITLLPKEEDPLSDKPQQSLLGYAFYKLEPLAYLMSNCSNIPIISVNGEVEGTITIDVVPVDEDGKEFEEIPDNPMDLVGENLKFYVHIKEIKDLPEKFCKGVQVEYTSFNDNQNYKTKIYNEDGKENSFVIDEKFEHKISYLNEEDIDFLTKDKICFKIYGYETVEIKGKNDPPNKEDIKKVNKHVGFDIDFKSEKKSKKKPLGQSRSNTDKKFLRNSTYKTSKTITKFKDKDKDCIIF
jgi:hypothetical protein